MGLWENLPIKNHCLTLTFLLRNVVAVTKDKGPYSQSYGLSSSPVQMWELDHKEGWAPKDWCFQIVDKILESPLDSKKIKPVTPKGNQPWIFIGRTVVDAEAPILRPPDVKSWLTGKDPDAGKDWRQKRKKATEDEMVGWLESMDMNLGKLQEIVKDGEACHTWALGVTKSWTRLSD